MRLRISRPVGLVAGGAWVLVVRKDLPVTTLAEFAAYARANQSRMQYGSAGVGSGTHITCVLLNMAIGTQITHVPYRGSGPAMQDLIAGRIDFLCDVISTAVPQIEAGTVKAIATLGESRAAVLPNVPTAGEQGFAEFDGNGWNALFFPKGTPAAIVQRMSRAASDAQDTPAVRERLEEPGAANSAARPADAANISPSSSRARSRAGPGRSRRAARRLIETTSYEEKETTMKR